MAVVILVCITFSLPTCSVRYIKPKYARRQVFDRPQKHAIGRAHIYLTASARAI